MNSCATTVSALLAVLLSAAAAPGAGIQPTSGALLESKDLTGLHAGLLMRFDSRALELDDDDADVESTRIDARIGFNPLPFLALWAEAGAMEAEMDDEKGDAGLDWGLGAYLRLADFSLRESPVVGPQERIGAGLSVLYRQSKSDFDKADYEWNEWRLAPTVSYTINREGGDVWVPYRPVETELELGAVFDSADGSYAEEDYDQSAFGILIGAGLRWKSNWTTRASAIFYGSSEHEFEVGVLRNF